MKTVMFVLVLFFTTVSLSTQISDTLKVDTTASKLRVVISTATIVQAPRQRNSRQDNDQIKLGEIPED